MSRDPAPGGAPHGEDIDRRVIRRALVAGGTVLAVLGGGGAVTALVLGGSPALAFAGLVAGATFGAVVCAGWLLASILLDVLAGRRPGRRRLWWAVVATLATFAGPVLLLAALQAASTAS